ncbi:hypothetical protein [Pseudobacteriovorax antillogorgiicola]|nr:hypothetical protein [Pseudobacteriovorax antillogorgiicola]
MLKKRLTPSTRVLKLKSSADGQILSDIDVSNIDTIFIDGNDKDISIKSLKGGELFQRVTIYKYTYAGTVTILDKRQTPGGNIFNLRITPVVMQAHRNESVELMKTPSGWNTVHQPRFFEISFGHSSEDNGVWVRDIFNDYHSTTTPSDLTTKSIDSNRKVALSNGVLYVRLGLPKTTTACQLLPDDNDVVRNYELEMITDGGNSVSSIWEEENIPTAVISRKYSADTPTVVNPNPLDIYTGYRILCFY